MDIGALARTLGSLGVILGLLAAALWIVRRYDISLPGRIGAGIGSGRRVAVVERVRLDAKRSLVLMRRDDREHLFVLLPDRVAVLETGIAPPVFALPVFAPPAIAPTRQDMVLCAELEDGWYAQ